MLFLLATIFTVRLVTTPPDRTLHPDVRSQQTRTEEQAIKYIALRLNAAEAVTWRVVPKDEAVHVEVTRVRQVDDHWVVHLAVMGPGDRSTAITGTGDTLLDASADAGEKLTRWAAR